VLVVLLHQLLELHVQLLLPLLLLPLLLLSPLLLLVLLLQGLQCMHRTAWQQQLPLPPPPRQHSNRVLQVTCATYR
jgi:hypothetical protein